MPSTFYTEEQISPKQAWTPEGFLLCLEVPIARTGELYYVAGEVPVQPGRDGVIYIQREATEVFHPNSIASWNGKPITNDHPPVPVTPRNWKIYAVGNVQNARQGEGAQAHLLIADFLITDEQAIADVRAGKREVSGGYDCEYQPTGDGRGRQTNIIGNHVALVPKGRCGISCSIGDSAMATKHKRHLLDASALSPYDRIRRAFRTQDAEALETELGNMMDAIEEPDDGDTHHHITINMPGSEGDMADKKGKGKDAKAKDAKAKDAEEKKDDEKTDDADPVMGAIKSLETRMGNMEDSWKGFQKDWKASMDAKAKDADEDDDEEEKKKAEAKKTEDKKTKDDDDDDDDDMDAMDKKKGTKDSAGLAAEWRDTLSRAEILAPGIGLPTFDAKAAHQITTDAMCGLRRKALRLAIKDDGKAKIIAPLLRGAGRAEINAMTCDQVAGLFIGSSELVRVNNNLNPGTGGKQQPAKTGALTFGKNATVDISALNNKAKELWGKAAR